MHRGCNCKTLWVPPQQPHASPHVFYTSLLLVFPELACYLVLLYKGVQNPFDFKGSYFKMEQRWRVLHEKWEIWQLFTLPLLSEYSTTPEQVRVFRIVQRIQQFTLALFNEDTGFHLYLKESGWNTKYCTDQEWIVVTEVVFSPSGNSLMCKWSQRAGSNLSPV